MKSSLAISAALVIIAVSCQRHTNEHQQVQQFIAASEQMLEQENVDSAWALLDATAQLREGQDGDFQFLGQTLERA